MTVYDGVYSVKRDGPTAYRVFWGETTPLTAPTYRHRAYVQLCEIMTLSRLLTKLAEEGETIEHMATRHGHLREIVRDVVLGSNNVSMVGFYVEQSYTLYKEGL